MTALIFPPERLRERREIRRLEEAVRKNSNVVRIGTNNFSRSDFHFPRAPEEQRFKDVPLEKSRPIKAWGHKLISFVGWTALIVAIILCLAVR